MAEWLLELFSEEIPARMQAGAARDLERMVLQSLVEHGGIPSRGLEAFCGPRRLTLKVDWLPSFQDERVEIRNGPRITAPEAAIHGFAARAGITPDQLSVSNGQYVSRIVIPERKTTDIIAQIVPRIVRTFPWPKSMTWGSGSLRWVRPLHRILCVFDGETVPFEVDGIVSGDRSEGHRVMAQGRVFSVRDFEDYRQVLFDNSVILETGKREDKIKAHANAIAEARGLSLVEDVSLLAEVAGMVEWPVVLLGDMDERFLQLPPEVIRTTMRTHQRYFAVRAPDGELAPHFVTVANLETPDGGALIAKGNGRVLAARLADARFFWDEDRKIRLEDRLSALEGVVFHAKLGTMRDRADRIERLAAAIAPLVGADVERARRAGRLAKSDLVSGMVAEFPELQGVMGGYYARAEGLGDDIADAIADHYRPQGPGDAAPTAPVTIAVALADKLDTIVGFFSIGEKPTGSRDPFALRRAALGVLRILDENEIAVGYRELVRLTSSVTNRPAEGVAEFFNDRLRVAMREKGEAEPDEVEAILAVNDDVPHRLYRRLKALKEFLLQDDGANLLEGSRRAANIVSAEAKKDPLPDRPPVRPAGPPAEIELYNAVEAVEQRLDTDLHADNFEAAMSALASLRRPVDRFFDQVLVNSDDPAERDNRLALLMRVRGQMYRVADFSLIKG